LVERVGEPVLDKFEDIPLAGGTAGPAGRAVGMAAGMVGTLAEELDRTEEILVPVLGNKVGPGTRDSRDSLAAGC
jgi:hypothetical protein